MTRLDGTSGPASMNGERPPVRIRRARPDDATAIAEIYNEGIRGRTATFETRERAAGEVRAWAEATRYPVVVAEADRQVIGWARAYQYRPRPCYDGVGECSVYVRGDARRRGVGRALLRALESACADAGFWKLVSRVFPENDASRALCERCGFREVGTYRRHARLDGEWRDVIIVERLLADECSNEGPPHEAPSHEAPSHQAPSHQAPSHQAPSHQEPTTRHQTPTTNP